MRVDSPLMPHFCLTQPELPAVTWAVRRVNTTERRYQWRRADTAMVESAPSDGTEWPGDNDQPRGQGALGWPGPKRVAGAVRRAPAENRASVPVGISPGLPPRRHRIGVAR